MKTKISFLFIVILLFGCTIDNEPEQNRQIPITFTEIGHGSVEGTGLTQSDFVVDNTTDWQNLLNRMDTNSNISGSFTQTNIDFNTYMLLVTILNVETTACEVSFTNIVENANEITATITERIGDATVISQPFCIVKIPKRSKPVVFVHN